MYIFVCSHFSLQTFFQTHLMKCLQIHNGSCSKLENLVEVVYMCLASSKIVMLKKRITFQSFSKAPSCVLSGGSAITPPTDAKRHQVGCVLAQVLSFL